MAAKTVHCVKLGSDLPGIDEDTPEGEMALKMCLLVGGRDFQKRVSDQISAQAWKMWTDTQVMVVNEYRLDPSSDQANAILKRYMEAFFFGDEAAIPNYVAPKAGGH